MKRAQKLTAVGFACLLFVLVIAFFFNRFVFLAVASASMEPTYCAGDILVSTHGERAGVDAVTIGEPAVFRHSGQLIVKRAVARSGDTVEFNSTKFRINGSAIDIPQECLARWADRSSRVPLVSSVVPDGYVYVLGDNYGLSKDSRIYGALRTSDIVGQVQMRLRLPWKDCICHQAER